MSCSVDIELDSLVCRTKSAAFQAAALLSADPWARTRLKVSPFFETSPERDDSWRLAIDDYDARYWNETEYRRLWLALAPFMADSAFIEFRHEEGSRFRVRWEAGRVFEGLARQVIWATDFEITPALLKD